MDGLILASKTLFDDSKTLSNYNITNNSTLESAFKVNTNNTVRIGDVKTMIKDMDEQKK